MYYWRIVVAVLLGLSFGWAQEPAEQEQEEPAQEQEETVPPTKRVRWGWQSYQEIAYNQFLGVPDTLTGSVEGLGSIKLNLSWIPHLRIGSALYAGVGFGLTIREVRFEEPVSLFRGPNDALGYRLDSLPSGVRAKSKLQLGYFRVPVEIGVLYKKFNFAVYGYGEALIWAKHKQKYREGSDLTRFISYGNRNFRTTTLQYGVGARVGYKGIGLFANYNLSPLWEAGKGPENVRAFQAGLYFFEIIKSKNKSRKTRLTATRL